MIFLARYWKWILGGLIVALLLSYIFRPEPKVPVEVLPPRVDSLIGWQLDEWDRIRIENALLRASQDSLKAENERLREEKEAAEREALRAGERAGIAAERARVAGDTLGPAWEAYREAARRGDFLALALQKSDSAHRQTQLQLQLTRAAYDDVYQSLDQSNQVIVELRESLDRAVQVNSCRILWFNCPSRTAAFGLGAAATVVTHQYFKSRDDR